MKEWYSTDTILREVPDAAKTGGIEDDNGL